MTESNETPSEPQTITEAVYVGPRAEDVDLHRVARRQRLRADIETAINCASAENGSDTPDFILAEYLTNCLEAFDASGSRKFTPELCSEEGCAPCAGSGGWNANLEAWWQEKTKNFPGGLSNAVWHMPDAATRRMAWLEASLPNGGSEPFSPARKD